MRLRVTFTKTGSLRYTGHLDLQTVWERTARRAGLPLAYTRGFHPGPRIQIAAALPLGFTGRAEIVDLWLGSPVEVEPVRQALQTAAPPGLGIASVEAVDEHGPALQTRVASADYEIALLEPIDARAVQERIADLLAADRLPRQRRGKEYDLRPLVESLSFTACPSPAGSREELRVMMRLAAREGATGRPEEVLDELGLPLEAVRVERTRLIFAE
jgi:radical SAM-linked protein